MRRGNVVVPIVAARSRNFVPGAAPRGWVALVRVDPDLERANPAAPWARLYAGLVVLVKRCIDGTPRHAMTVDAYLASPLSRLEGPTRDPIR